MNSSRFDLLARALARRSSRRAVVVAALLAPVLPRRAGAADVPACTDPALCAAVRCDGAGCVCDPVACQAAGGCCNDGLCCVGGVSCCSPTLGPGVCLVLDCFPPSRLCPVNPGDPGCEVACVPPDDPANCGACGNACPAGRRCRQGTCGRRRRRGR